MGNPKIWFITGASKGLGRILAKQLLEAGEIVAATSRDRDELINAVGQESARFLPLEVYLADTESVSQAIRKTQDTFKRIDVVVNNAGFGIGGCIEELTDEETRACFEVNVFGMMNVIRSVLPYLRAQHSGHIVNISSIAGISAKPGAIVYAATKFAVVGLSESLAEDVREFGIRVTVVAPGLLRTNFIHSDSFILPKRPIPAYTNVHSSLKKYFGMMNGIKLGDPEKAAAALIRTVNDPAPPFYLLLGSDAYQVAMNKLDNLGKAFTASKELAESIDFTC